MKKIIAVLMVIAMLFAFASCSSKKYKDTVVTIPVTDENGEQVTDKDGNPVTEIVSIDEDDSKDASDKTDKADASKNEADKSTTAKQSDKTTKKSEKSTTSKKGEAANGKESQSSKTTEKKETTKSTTKKTTEKTTESTTKKPEKREVKVKVVLPYYNDIESELTVKFKVEGDDNYKTLKFADKDNPLKRNDYDVVRLDGKTVKEYSLGEYKGSVKVKIELSGVSLSSNVVVIDAYSKNAEITPATGIEMIDGEII